MPLVFFNRYTIHTYVYDFFPLRTNHNISDIRTLHLILTGNHSVWINEAPLYYNVEEKKTLSTLWELNGSSFDQTWTMLCAKFGSNWPSGFGEEDENVKSLRRQRRR